MGNQCTGAPKEAAAPEYVKDIRHSISTLHDLYNYYEERRRAEVVHAVQQKTEKKDMDMALMHMKTAKNYEVVKANILATLTLFNKLHTELENVRITANSMAILKTHSDTLAQHLDALNRDVNVAKTLRSLQANVDKLRNTDAVIHAAAEKIRADEEEQLMRDLDAAAVAAPVPASGGNVSGFLSSLLLLPSAKHNDIPLSPQPQQEEDTLILLDHS